MTRPSEACSRIRPSWPRCDLTSTILVSDGCLEKYRIHRDSVVPESIRRGHDQLAQGVFLRWLESYLIQCDVRDPEIWRRLSVALRRHRLRRWNRVVKGADNLISSSGRSIGRIANRLIRSLRAQRTGQLAARPNPIETDDWFAVGKTRLSWEAPGAKVVEVRQDAPDGPLVVASGSSGTIVTELTVVDGTTFFLQDVWKGPPHRRQHLGQRHRPGSSSGWTTE